MKIINNSYTFNASTKQISSSLFVGLNQSQILLINNVTRNKIIYDPSVPGTGGSLSNEIMTLSYDTSGYDNQDILQIFLDNGKLPASEDTTQALLDAVLLLKRIAKNLESLTIIDSQQRQRITVDAGTLNTVTTVATVATITNSNVTTLGSVPCFYQLTDWARQSYNDGIRNKLTFS